MNVIVTNEMPCTSHGTPAGKDCPCVGKTIKEANKR